jgi:sugar phosphate isomerase/epimerase
MAVDLRRVALELATLHEHLKTTEDAARSLAQVREIGYERVTLGLATAAAAATLKQQADAAGLTIVAACADAREIVEQPKRVADMLSTLGCRLVIYPQPHAPLATLDQVFALCDDLSRAGELLRSRGQQLCYRNHALEFRRLGGKAILDWIYERTDPILVQGALDTYGVQAGGAEPAGYCARLSGRLPLLLLQDYAISPKNEPFEAALGDGNLSLSRILREAEAAACDWYVVGQGGSVEAPFAAIARSLSFLKSL